MQIQIFRQKHYFCIAEAHRQGNTCEKKRRPFPVLISFKKGYLVYQTNFDIYDFFNLTDGKKLKSHDFESKENEWALGSLKLLEFCISRCIPANHLGHDRIAKITSNFEIVVRKELIGIVDLLTTQLNPDDALSLKIRETTF